MTYGIFLFKKHEYRFMYQGSLIFLLFKFIFIKKVFEEHIIYSVMITRR